MDDTQQTKTLKQRCIYNYLQGNLFKELKIKRFNFSFVITKTGDKYLNHIIIIEDSTYFISFVHPYYYRLLHYVGEYSESTEKCSKQIEEIISKVDGANDNLKAKLLSKLIKSQFKLIFELRDPYEKKIEYKISTTDNFFNIDVDVKFVQMYCLREKYIKPFIYYNLVLLCGQLDKEKECSDILISEGIHSDNNVILTAAIRIVAERKLTEYILTLRELLKNENRSIKIETAICLGMLACAEAIDGLLEALKDRDNHVKYKALLALTRLKVSNLDEILIKAMDDSNEVMRMYIITFLGKLIDEKSLRAIKFIYKATRENSNSGVREVAKRTFYKILSSEK